MENLKVRTRGNASPQGKPRVYFTCHPADFSRSFDKICEDILKICDCAIYYTQDMNVQLPEETRIVDLERMNLFVIPVSFRLLSTPNRAMDFDFAFSQERHIAVLPVLLEPGLDAIYSRPDRFGELQYLDPLNQDITAVSYADKLKRFLESALISNEMAERVRAAFDAYIFLSYRKKDRKYANELMRLIHENPVCRDIAIWYDEFLTPGENFNDAIGLAIEKSELFTLLVTPNLINEVNYVCTTEYPMAQNAGKSILPAEMVATDSAGLKRQFDGIPESVNARDAAAFKARLLESVSTLALRENDGDPTHNFLIGLAYLDGIDVEVDRTRALELITSAAEAELPVAMEKLCSMYYEGTCVPRSYRTVLKWSRKIADYYTREKGEGHQDTLTALDNLSVALHELGEYSQALKLDEKVYEFQSKVLGEEHLDTLDTLNDLAYTLWKLGEHRRSLELYEKAYELRCKVLGEEHPQTLAVMSNLITIYANLQHYAKAIEMGERLYEIRCHTLGANHSDTVLARNILIEVYKKAGKNGIHN